MDVSLQLESEKLARSWMQHESGWLKDYLVAGVEDPRINAQSILSRHFLLEALFGDRLAALMDQEYRFAAAMNWLAGLGRNIDDADTAAAILHALRLGADNAEGIEVPEHVRVTFSQLPAATGPFQVPNYLEAYLAAGGSDTESKAKRTDGLGTFLRLWHEVLTAEGAAPTAPASTPAAAREPRVTVLEPACGSANDYRFLQACGLAPWLDYTGLDLCPKNIENARALFPQVRFEVGNVFEIPAPDRAYQLTYVHDLFEHLSAAGLEVAVRELCRVTRDGMCLGFFNVDEISDHVICPTEEYHWNTLSMAKLRAMFAREGFAGQVMHIGAFLQDRAGCDQTHNPNAYTFRLRRVG